jgi:hypothetical protein
MCVCGDAFCSARVACRYNYQLLTYSRYQPYISPDSQCRRDKVIVGHSIVRDVEIIQRLRVNLHDIPPVLVAIDTYNTAQSLLERRSTLESLLTEPNCLSTSQTFTTLEMTLQIHSMQCLWLQSKPPKADN